jgi:predicted NAD/FAD-dependent oxidoreductase
MRVAIIGAGVAGLSCARALSAGGATVTVFDKGRGPAGRISTRRAAVPFDHGAQYFTTRDEAFQAEVARLMLEDVVAEWSPRIVAIDRIGGAARPSSDLPRFVGVPGMNAIAQALAAPLDVQVNVTVTAVERVADGWHLKASGEDLPGRFDAVVLTAPPVQTATLLGAHPLAEQAAAARMAPCWAVMTSWADAVDVPYDAAFVNEGPLAWIARDGSKPGRPHPHTWVLHASPTWSTEHLEQTPDEVLPMLLDAFEAIVRRPLPTLAFSTAHRWRYAYVTSVIDEPYLWDATDRIGAAGDWCRAPRVEGAWLSGRALAGAMLAS